jgi:hypothetical protein
MAKPFLALGLPEVGRYSRNPFHYHERRSANCEIIRKAQDPRDRHRTLGQGLQHEVFALYRNIEHPAFGLRPQHKLL